MVEVDARRAAIEALYIGKCDVFEWQETTDPDSKITGHSEIEVLSNQSCRLSFKTITATGQTSGPAKVTQTVKLFIAPEVMIRPGSKIVVTQNGRVTAYKDSGSPAVYSSHQEIPLEIFERWS